MHHHGARGLEGVQLGVDAFQKVNHAARVVRHIVVWPAGVVELFDDSLTSRPLLSFQLKKNVIITRDKYNFVICLHLK